MFPKQFYQDLERAIVENKVSDIVQFDGRTLAYALTGFLSDHCNIHTKYGNMVFTLYRLNEVGVEKVEYEVKIKEGKLIKRFRVTLPTEFGQRGIVAVLDIMANIVHTHLSGQDGFTHSKQYAESTYNMLRKFPSFGYWVSCMGTYPSAQLDLFGYKSTYCN